MNVAGGDRVRVVDAYVAFALAPLDAARSALLRVPVAAARRLVADRDARIAALGAIAIAVAVIGAAVAPLWLMVLGPLVLGVPHLLADLRYLVMKPQLHRRALAWLAVGLPLAATWIFPKVWVGLFASMGVLVIARADRTSLARRLAVGALLALAIVWSERAGRIAEVVFAHAHNAIAILLFVLWSAQSNTRPTRFRAAPIALAVSFCAIAAAILGGALDRLFVVARAYSAPATGLDIDGLIRTLSPVADPLMGLRWVLLFAFAQSLHYAIWLRLVPERARERPGMRPFASSYRALVTDVGRPLVVLAAIVTIALMAYALFDVRAARDGYLRMAVFHGHLEVAALTFFVLERRGLGRVAC